MVFGWGHSERSYDQCWDTSHKDDHPSLKDEVIAGGAAFGAFRAFEDHRRKKGKPVSHQLAKDMLAGFAGAEVEKLVQRHGEDKIDRERARMEAREQAEHMYDDYYVQGSQAECYDPGMYGPPPRLIERNCW